MPSSRPGAVLPALVPAAAAVALHLPAQLGRTALFEDTPALVANARLEPSGTEGLLTVLARAATDPLAAWTEGGNAICTSRWRPVAGVAAAFERWIFGSGVLQGAGWVSLALHAGVVLLALRLFRLLALPGPACWAATFVVAAAPSALSAAAWPAHQAVVLAAFFGLLGLTTGLTGGRGRGLAAGALLCLAGLAHEFAFAGFAALWLLRANGDEDPAQRRGRRVASLAAPVAAVAFFVVYVLPRLVEARVALPGVYGDTPAPLDGAAGVLHGLLSVAVPSRLHFADGPWIAAWPARIVSAVGVAWIVSRAWKSQAPGARLLLAGIAGLLPLVLTGLPGCVAGAPFHDAALYLALPCLAGALACAVASAVSRGGAWRTAGIAAGALWVGATVAATVVRSPSFGDREAQTRLALRETRATGSAVADAWALESAVSAWIGTVGRERTPPDEIVRRTVALGRRALSKDAVSLSGDPVASYTIAASLTHATTTLEAIGLPRDAPEWEGLTDAAAAATEIAPSWVQTWLVLARTCEQTGLLRRAAGAVDTARRLAPYDVLVLREGVRTSLAVGRSRLAATLADLLIQCETDLAREQGRRASPESLFLFAQACTAEGRERVLHPVGDTPDRRRVRMRFEWAIEALEELAAAGGATDAVREQAYLTTLRYGDVLASMDRTALALSAYRRAVAIPVRDPSEAKEHMDWLLARLAAELQQAVLDVERARTGVGNSADALIALATAYSRQALWDKAAEVLDYVESQIGTSPELRLRRAVLLQGDRNPDSAVTEIQAVLAERPLSPLARFELAKLLEDRGDLEAALREYREASKSALESARRTGAADEWILDADERGDAVERLLRARRSSQPH